LAGVSRRVGAWAALLSLAAVLLGVAVAERGAVPAVGPSRAVALPWELQAVAQRAIGGSERRFCVGRRGGVLAASGGGNRERL
jgi:hypothetical protein